MSQLERAEATHFTPPQIDVRSNVKDVHDQLGHGVTSYPQENVLAVFQQVEAVSFQSFTGQRQGLGQNDAIISNRATLKVHVKRQRGRSQISNERESHTSLGMSCNE